MKAKNNPTLHIILIATLLFAGVIAIHAYRTRLCPPLMREDVSWKSYCAQAGINPDTPSQDDIDDYNDTWLGSVPEEEALIKAGFTL